jgi:hypothetical protein
MRSCLTYRRRVINNEISLRPLRNLSALCVTKKISLADMLEERNAKCAEDDRKGR